MPMTESASFAVDKFTDFWHDGRPSKMEMSEEGFLTGHAIVSTIGVYRYVRDDGTISNQLRPPQEVLNPKSLETLAGKPVTLGHPEVAVTPENVKDYAIGSVGNLVEVDRTQTGIIAPIVIHAEEAIQRAKSGEMKQLSCGYWRTLRMDGITYADGTHYPCPGVYLGMAYDSIQTDIVYNHLALVGIGRAGDLATLVVDRADCSSGSGALQNPRPSETNHMRKIAIDGKDHEVSDDVANFMERLRGEIDTAKVALDSAKATLTAKDAEIAQLKAVDHSAEIASRVALLSKVAALGVDSAQLVGKSANEIRVVALKHLQPALSVDGKHEQYIEAAFDFATREKEGMDGQSQENNRRIAGDAGKYVDVVDAARKGMLENLNKGKV